MPEQEAEADENYLEGLGGNAGDLEKSSDGEDVAIEEDANLEAYDCFNRGFVRALTLAVQDIGSSSKQHREDLITGLSFSFRNIIRLSKSITGSRGAVADFNNFYASEIVRKANSIFLIGDAIAQS